MTVARKILAAAALLAFASGAASSLDYGIELLNKVGIYHTDDMKWFTDHQAALWMKIPLDKQNVNSLAIEGRLYGAKTTSSDEFTSYANLELFRISLVPISDNGMRLAIDAGRIRSGDATGYILNQAIDGAEFHGSFSFGNLDILAGYTGLLNARKTGALMSEDDFADMDSDALYVTGAKRLVGKATVQIPQLVGPLDLIAEATGQYDLRDQIESDPAQLVHTGYGTLSLSGPVAENLYLTASGTWQMGILKVDKDYSENAMLMIGRLDWFAVKSGKLYMEILYTSAEGDFFTSFLPITFQSAGELYSDGYGNLIKGSAGVNYNPVELLNLDMSCRLFMYPKEIIDGEGIYRGTELFGGATFLARSDLRLRCEGALYFPKEEDSVYQASLKAILDL